MLSSYDDLFHSSLLDQNLVHAASCLTLMPGADQFLSDRRGADFPAGGCIDALPKRLLRFQSFKNSLYQ